MMIEALGLTILAVACAFFMGYSINEGSTCAVSAAQELVDQRRATMLTGFAVAIGAAGLICLPVAWIFGSDVHLASDTPVSLALIAGAILLGIGAVINDACLLGTLARIGHGEVRFFALPVGLTAGFFIADRQSWAKAGDAIPNALAQPGPVGFLVVAGFAVIVIAAYRRLGQGLMPPSLRDWPLRRAMLVLGVCGALLFTLTPGWTYADAVRRAVAPGEQMTAIGFGVVIAALAALAGALASGIRARSFHFQKPTVRTLLRSLIGGTVMAFGGTLIPGGNDSLLLSSVPSATVSGLTAYAIMSLTVPLLLLVLRWLRSRTAQ
jgi:uncharacterized protein